MSAIENTLLDSFSGIYLVPLDKQVIHAVGTHDWNLEEGELLDVGIMGFAENTELQTHAPSVANFRILE